MLHHELAFSHLCYLQRGRETLERSFPKPHLQSWAMNPSNPVSGEMGTCSALLLSPNQGPLEKGTLYMDPSNC